MLVRRFSNILSLSWFRRLAVGLSAQRTGFDPGLVHVRFVLWHWDMFLPPPPHISPMFHVYHYINSTRIRRTSGRSLGDVRRKQFSLSRWKGSFTSQNLRFFVATLLRFRVFRRMIVCSWMSGSRCFEASQHICLKRLKMSYKNDVEPFGPSIWRHCFRNVVSDPATRCQNPLLSLSSFKDVTYPKRLQVWIFEPEVPQHVGLSSSFTAGHLKTQICSPLWRFNPIPSHGLNLRGLRNHTHTHHTRYDSSGRVISPSQRPLPHTTLIGDRHPCPRRDASPQPQQASGGRATP
jgi:hypothetical protein